MKDGTLRWGLVGAGKIAFDFAQSLTKGERSHKVVAVAASSKERAQELITKLGLDAQAYGDYAEVARDPNVDVVYIGLHNEAHHPWTLNALEAGKPVVCEKPIGVNAREAKEMIEAAKQRGLLLMEAFWSRYFPVWQHIKRIIDTKQFGEARIAHAVFGYPHVDHWRCLERGESPLTMYALYTIMFAQFVFGRKPNKLTATGAKDRFGTDSWGSIVMEFGEHERAITYYDSHTHLPQNAFISFEEGQVQIPGFFWCPEQFIEIKGPAATDDADRKLHEYPLNDDRPYNYSHSSGLRYEADHVYDLLKQGLTESPIMSHKDTIELHEMLQEIRHQLGVVFPHDLK